jgi:hypothetical protein
MATRSMQFCSKGSVGMLCSGFLQPNIEEYRATHGCNFRHSRSLRRQFVVTLLRDRLQGMQYFGFLMQPNRR